MKRILDVVLSVIALTITAPLIFIFCLLIWLEDQKSPFYISTRVARYGRDFKMLKLRSMKVDSDKSGVASTSSDDDRITQIGKYVRRFKVDELLQLVNVLAGSMSLVGPRPNVRSEVDTYTANETRMLDVRPGITDFASIVFADEGDILKGSADPDLSYNELIRPIKSRLALGYIENRSVFLDIKILIFTAISFVSRRRALEFVSRELNELKFSSDLIQAASRKAPLKKGLPP